MRVVFLRILIEREAIKAGRARARQFQYSGDKISARRVVIVAEVALDSEY